MKNKDQEKKDHSKKFAAGTSLLLALALLTTSSLAFRDVDQYKENKFKKSNLDFNVVLVENFEPETNWEAGEKIKKEVHVRNGQDSDPKDEKYEDAYIRLKFSEYMGITEKDYKYADGKYMIDTNGEFIRVSAKSDENEEIPEEVKKEFEAMGIDKLDEEGRIVWLTDGFDGKNYYYIKSFESDPHGQWGKKVVISIGEGEEEPLVETDSEATSKYIPHLWSEESGYTSGYAKESDFSKYVNWELGDDVITLNMWQTNFKSRPVKKWILDTSDDEEGWVYWGEPLVHNNKNASASKTSKLLQAVESINFPDGDIAYDLKVEMEAFSLMELIGLSIENNDGLETNHDWNKEILAALLKKDELSLKLKELQRLVNLGDRTLKNNADLETVTVTALRGAVDSGKKILDTNVVNIEFEKLEPTINQLDAAIKAVQSDETIKLYKEYKNAIKFANEKIETASKDETIFQGTVVELKISLDKYKKKFNDIKEINTENLGEAIDELKLKYEQVVKNKVELGGHEWQVIGAQSSSDKKFTQSMLVLDKPIESDLYEKLTIRLQPEDKEKIKKGEYYLTTMYKDQDILLNSFYDVLLDELSEEDGLESNILRIDKDGKVNQDGTGGKITSFGVENFKENIHIKTALNNEQYTKINENDKPVLSYELPDSLDDLPAEEMKYWTKYLFVKGGNSHAAYFTKDGEFGCHDVKRGKDHSAIRPVIWVRVDDNIDLGQEKMKPLD